MTRETASFGSSLPLSVGLSLISLSTAFAAGCSTDLGSRTCAPGREVACTCSGGALGHQICRADGTGFGACACEGGDAGLRVDGGAVIPIDGGSSEVDAWTAPAVDAWTAPAPDAWMGTDSGPPAPSCAWVWIDRGGPAFQPHACRAGPGVVDGMLVDPMAFFAALVAGRDPETWTTVMAEIEGELWSCGVGQQRGTAGDVRGRLFLPTAACPDASPPPGDDHAAMLGVRQDMACWDHPADVVDCH
jgi:hypothetical protein